MHPALPFLGCSLLAVAVVRLRKRLGSCVRVDGDVLQFDVPVGTTAWLPAGALVGRVDEPGHVRAIVPGRGWLAEWTAPLRIRLPIGGGCERL